MSLTPGPKWKPAFSPLTPAGRRETCAQGRQAWGSVLQAAGTPGSALRVPTGDPGGILAASDHPVLEDIPGSSALEEGSAP